MNVIEFFNMYIKQDISAACWIAAAVLGAAMAAVFAVAVKRKKLSAGRAAAIWLLVIELFFLLSITVFSRERSESAKYILTPFWSYKMIFDGSKYYIYEVVFNILMFVPIGITLPFAAGKRLKFWQAVIFFAACSYTAELLQLILHAGIFELVDDPLNNIAGGIIGFAAAAAIRAIVSLNGRNSA